MFYKQMITILIDNKGFKKKFGNYFLLGYCGHASSSKSFIYSLYNINGYAPVKLSVKPGRQSQAIWSCSRDGPTFGYNDIHVTDNADRRRLSQTLCGTYYYLPPGYSSSGSSCNFFAGGGSYTFIPTDVEVFYEKNT